MGPKDIPNNGISFFFIDLARKKFVFGIKCKLREAA